MADELNELGALPFGGPTEDEKAMLGIGEPPAYLRRGMSVDDAEARVHRQCEAARNQMLFGVKLRVRGWNRLLHAHPQLRESMSEAARQWIDMVSRAIFSADEPSVSVAPAGWKLFASRQWRAIGEAVQEFNANWTRFLETFPLDDLHRVVDGYNRYYVLEKECAVRSIHTARRGFVPREKTSVEDLLGRFPPLPIPPESYR